MITEPVPTLHDALARLTPLAAKVGSASDVAAFQRAVNLAFHACESTVYDEVHQSMRDSLPIQFSLLAADCQKTDIASRDNLRLLDVGCGTGLSSELFLKTKLGQRIKHISLVDTSPQMLALAKKKVKRLGWTAETFNGELSSVPNTERYDIILACSVLHHIPDLPAFLQQVALRQHIGGVFVHLQDPNADHQATKQARSRLEKFRNSDSTEMIRGVLERMHVLRFAVRLRRFIKRIPDYLTETNAILIREGVITRALTPREIWSVTDIHVGKGGGVSLNAIGAQSNYELIRAHSYAFFGKLQSELPREFAEEEARLIESGAEDGTQLSATWVRTAEKITLSKSS